MPSNTTDEGPAITLPDDLTDAKLLAVQLGLPPSIAESVLTLLRDAGRIYAPASGTPNPHKSNLCSRREYLNELASFCDRVPGAASALANNRAIRQAHEREQARIDRQVAALEKQKGKQQ